MGFVGLGFEFHEFPTSQRTTLDNMSSRSYVESVNATQALDAAKRLARGGQVWFRQHAYDRMAERNAVVADVIAAILTSTRAAYQSDRDNWKLTGGADLDGDDMVVIVDFVGDLVIVTIY